MVKQTTDTGYIVTGIVSAGGGDVSGFHVNEDGWVVKLDKTGAIQWNRALGGVGYDDLYAITQSSDGGYVTVGTTSSTSNDLDSATGAGSVWVVKLNNTAGIVWEKRFGDGSLSAASHFNTAFSVSEIFDNGYIISGSDQGPDSFYTDNHGQSDAMLMKINDTGALVWKKSLGGTQNDEGLGNAFQTPDSGYIMITGTNSNNLEVSGNHGGFDYWVVKLSKCMVDAGTLSGDSVVCIGNNGSSVSSTVTGGAWSVSNGKVSVAGGVLTGISTGRDTVLYTVTNAACGYALAYIPVRVEACPEVVALVSNDPKITIEPNPTTGTIYIQGAMPAKIEVYNVLGQKVKEAYNTGTLSIAESSAGVYFVKVFDAQGVVIKQGEVLRN